MHFKLLKKYWYCQYYSNTVGKNGDFYPCGTFHISIVNQANGTSKGWPINLVIVALHRFLRLESLRYLQRVVMRFFKEEKVSSFFLSIIVLRESCTSCACIEKIDVRM